MLVAAFSLVGCQRFRMTAGYLPYHVFSKKDWGQYRCDMPMTLDENDLSLLQGVVESVSLEEIEAVYLPLSRLLGLYVTAAQKLQLASMEFLDRKSKRVPYIIGVAGSVAVGKSTTSRVLQALLSKWPDHPRVAIVTTDAFLYSNAELERRGLMMRKGFPESYNVERLLAAITALKSGVDELSLPVYSHYHYDILPGESRVLSCPDIVIVEGLNILQQAVLDKAAPPKGFIADLLDFSIFVDADTSHIRTWFLERFSRLRDKAENDAKAFFHRFAFLSKEESLEQACVFWDTINQVNLTENILPFKYRSDLILHKGADHTVNQIMLRKL